MKPRNPKPESNLVCFIRHLGRIPLVLDKGWYHFEVVLKGEGNNADRTYHIELPAVLPSRGEFTSNRDYIDTLKDMRRETSLWGYRRVGGEIEYQEIPLRDIQSLGNDLNVPTK